MEEIVKKKKKFKFKFPLWAKTLIVLLLSVSAVSTVAIVYSSNYVKNLTMQEYVNKSIQLADSLAVHIDNTDFLAVRDKTYSIYSGLNEDQLVSNESWGEQEWVDYFHLYDEVTAMPAYERLLDQISRLHEANRSALYTYVSLIDFDRQLAIYLVDDSELGEDDPDDPGNTDAKYISGERCLPGMFDCFTEQDKGVINHKLSGFEPEITNFEQYQWLISTGRPIFAPGAEKTEANIQGYAFVEFSMDAIVAEQNKSIQTLVWILVILGVAAVLVGYLLVVFFLLRPVRKLTRAANEYAVGDKDKLDSFSKVKIKTRDEIEDLSNSMKKMEGDINQYIIDLLSSEKKADEFKNLADRDALTGANNKRAYFEAEERLNREIKNGTANFAITMIDLNDLKVTNDTFGHEKGDELIITLCHIIEDIFVSSSMYRIGGDEFVVISENGDLENIYKLQQAFVAAIKKTGSKEDELTVSAAIGVAIYDPKNDNNVEDTFKRADNKMYENKKQMKGNA